MASNNPSLNYRKDIDGLRGVSVCAVVFFHAFPHLLPGGFLGVDVFFVISGFLITAIFLKSPPQKEQTIFQYLSNFYKRRAVRLFPSLIILLMLVLISGFYLLLPSELASLAEHSLAGIFFLENLNLVAESSEYFQTSIEYKPLMHLWSLSIEEQFYLFYPILFLCTFRRISRFRRWVALTAILSLGAYVISAESFFSHGYFLPFTRAWQILVGCYGALTQQRLSQNKRLREAWSFISFCLIVAAIVLVPSAHSPSIIINQILVSLGALGLLVSDTESFTSRTLLSKNLLVYLGKVSYPFYLFHWSFLSFLAILSTKTTNSLPITAALIAALSAAVLTFELVEKKVKKSGRNALFFTSLLLVIAGVSFWIYARGGLPRRNYFLKYAYLDQRFIPAEFSNNCDQMYPHLDQIECHLSRLRAPRTAILGDSHAEDLFPGLVNSRLKGGVISLSGGSCQPFTGRISLNTDPEHCQDLIEGGLKFILSSAAIQNVVLTSRLSFTHLNFKDPQREAYYKKQLRKTLTALTGASKNVIFVFDRPELKFHVKDCLADLRPINFLKNSKSCDSDKSLHLISRKKFITFFNTILEDFPQVQVLDSLEIFCPDNKCFSEVHSRIMYRDQNHLSVHGSEVVGREILKMLR